LCERDRLSAPVTGSSGGRLRRCNDGQGGEGRRYALTHARRRGISVELVRRNPRVTHARAGGGPVVRVCLARRSQGVENVALTGCGPGVSVIHCVHSPRALQGVFASLLRSLCCSPSDIIMLVWTSTIRRFGNDNKLPNQLECIDRSSSMRIYDHRP
jgi:hypothetical protein